MGKFKVGDKVVIKKTSDYYAEKDEFNPINTAGVIIEIDCPAPLELKVRWENETVNSYNTKDLEYNMLEKTPKAEGIKYDGSKPPMDLLPYESLEEIAKVLGFGAKKYERANWAKGINQSRLIAAALRHIGQFNNGEDFDKESETLHLANAACNLLFAIWMYKNRPDMDDRWVKSIKGKDE